MTDEVVARENGYKRGYSLGRAKGFGIGAEWCIKLISSVLLNYGIDEEIVDRAKAILEKERETAVQFVYDMAKE